MNKLTNRLRVYRTAAALTQAALAERVRVSRKTINTIENAIFIPSTVLALRLAAVFDCHVEDIFALAPDDPNSNFRPNQ